MLTLQFIPYKEIQSLSSEKRISKILNIVKNDKIVLLQGRLFPEEETTLIERTMEQISRSKFKGVEICTVMPNTNQTLIDKIRNSIASALLGNRDGVTIIGPASIVKEIKRDPDKILLFTKEAKKRRRR
ncbi:MAG: DUF2073 domain-containing protein [Candidatus Woesearchaeota archaeon]|nr:MAG: DUF2073 domain-containing protein [Candidatus Woesearchaeota archaeon]